MDFDLSRDLIRSTFLENASRVDVGALGILADHREVDVLDADSFQRTKSFVEESNGPDIRVKIQAEPKREKYLRSVALIGNAWIADGPEQNGIEILSQHFKGAGRQRYSLFEIFLGTPIEFDKFQSRAEYFIDAA